MLCVRGSSTSGFQVIQCRVTPTSLEDLALLRETVELECKLAQGQNGQGEVPKDFWPTYSAMANAHGGVVLLGVREKEGVFSIAGIANPAKVRADLFNNLNNPDKVSANLLTDADVQELSLENKSILVVRIAQATRQQRPLFLNGQPLGHTYRRLNEGDRVCDDATVKRMLAEQLEDTCRRPGGQNFGRNFGRNVIALADPAAAIAHTDCQAVGCTTGVEPARRRASTGQA